MQQPWLLRRWCQALDGLAHVGLAHPNNDWSTYNGKPTLRNQGFIAALTKGNQWLISPCFPGPDIRCVSKNHPGTPIIMLLHFYSEPWLLQKEHMFISLGWIRYGQYLETGHVEFEEKKPFGAPIFETSAGTQRPFSTKPGCHYKKPQTIHDQVETLQLAIHLLHGLIFLQKWVPFPWLVRSTPTICIQLLIINDKLTSEKRGWLPPRKLQHTPRAHPGQSP